MNMRCTRRRSGATRSRCRVVRRLYVGGMTDDERVSFGRGLVEVDERWTWPDALLSVVSDMAGRYADALYTQDVSLSEDDEMAVRRELVGVKVAAYHATRLLPAEIEDILRGGLRMLDEELLEDKVRGARECGALTPLEADAVLAGRMPLDGSSGRRVGQVCAVAPRRGLDVVARGLAPLLSSWGGEALYFRHEFTPLGEKLRRVGVPAIVALAVSADGANDLWFPGLPALLVGAHLGLDEVASDVFVRRAAPASDVLGVWTPGHPDYEWHGFAMR